MNLPDSFPRRNEAQHSVDRGNKDKVRKKAATIFKWVPKANGG